MEPQVKPPPNAASIKLSPFLNNFSKSQKQSGIEPAVVFPYFSIFNSTFSGPKQFYLKSNYY